MTALLDVNVLVALLWEAHLHHGVVRRWFAARREPWSTCAVTQTGFVRVSSNPAVLSDAISVREAVAVLAAAVAHPAHVFLGDVAGFVDNPLVPHDRLVGHRQVTDAHLIAIARSHGATVVTLDAGMASLAPDVVRAIA
jgi:toxin-antitoxin system PIN domain toxin